jgi:ketosteroid isomerase-like protein
MEKQESIQIKEELKHSMEDLLHSYECAFRDLDASKVISHYFDSPQFQMINDGKIMGFHDLEKELRSLFTNMTKFEGGFIEPKITVINENLVSANSKFRETITFFGGEKFDVKGEVTWMAKLIDGRLKFVYGHEFHKQTEVE